MTGTSITKYLPPADPGRVMEKMAALVSGAIDGIQADSPMARADGSEVWVHWTSTAVRDAEGDLEYFLTTLEDITATHKARESPEKPTSRCSRG